ncbi:MAG: hypothetical protein A3J83_03265 [Elusimicrobia bacterium RIFOXYA2_FULL_40_6]|nr:MAG: hypothetical protein A3J83_03265 [Elusimicrobia bacterium RIFOXYA2_FULL_40_6]
MENLLNIKQLSEFIGVKEKTIYDFVYHDRIPFVKIGRLLRFRREIIEEWIESKTHLSQSRKILYNPSDDLARGEGDRR